MDLESITASVAALKSGAESVRSLLGLVKDVQGVLPAGEKKEAIAVALAAAEKQARLAEAEIGKAFGYAMCRCTTPPTPMLKVGYRRLPNPGPGWREVDVNECPRCQQTDAYGSSFQRKISIPGELPGAGA